MIFTLFFVGLIVGSATMSCKDFSCKDLSKKLTPQQYRVTQEKGTERVNLYLLFQDVTSQTHFYLGIYWRVL